MNRQAALLVTLILILPACTRTPDTEGKQFVNMDGMQIHYTQSGMGDKALLMIHGYGSGAFTWKGIQDRTPPGYTTYAIDLPGFGYSDKPPDFEYSLPAFSKIVGRFLEIACPARTVLVGNSMGGAVSIWTAANQPDRVAAVVPIDSAGGAEPQGDSARRPRSEAERDGTHAPGSLPFVFDLIRKPVIGPFLLSLPARPLMRNTLKEVYAHDDRISEDLIDSYYLPTRFPGAARAWHRTLADLLDRADRGDVLAQMEKVKMPVLLLWGDHDTWTPPARKDVFTSRMPQARVKMYPDLGHVPQEEDPDQVAPDLFAFADEVFAGLH